MLVSVIALFVSACAKAPVSTLEPQPEQHNLHQESLEVKAAVERFRQVAMSKESFRQKFLSDYYLSELRGFTLAKDPTWKDSYQDFVGELELPATQLLKELSFSDWEIKDALGMPQKDVLGKEDKVNVALMVMSIQEFYVEETGQLGGGGHASTHQYVMDCVARTLGITADAMEIVGGAFAGLRFVGGKAAIRTIAKTALRVVSRVGIRAMGAIGMAVMAAEVAWCVYDKFQDANPPGVTCSYPMPIRPRVPEKSFHQIMMELRGEVGEKPKKEKPEELMYF